METLLYRAAIFLVLFHMTSGQVTVDPSVEPTCSSRFDHDFKVLQKLVELEQAQKELATKMEQLFIKNDSSDRCPNGWTRYENSCYTFIDSILMTWDEGVQHCASFCGGHLANIETYDEQSFLRYSVKKLKNSVGSGKWYWVGASDSDKEGTWVWQSSGELVSAGGVRWYPGQPSGSPGENCACLWSGYDFTFHDYICSSKGYIICEKEMGSERK